MVLVNQAFANLLSSCMERLQGEEENTLEENVQNNGVEVGPSSKPREDLKDDSKVLFSLKDFFDRSKQIEENEQVQINEETPNTDSDATDDEESDVDSSDKDDESDLEVMQSENVKSSVLQKEQSELNNLPETLQPKPTELEKELNKVDNVLGKLKSKLESDAHIIPSSSNQHDAELTATSNMESHLKERSEDKSNLKENSPKKGQPNIVENEQSIRLLLKMKLPKMLRRKTMKSIQTKVE